jgi:hypothetical protein
MYVNLSKACDYALREIALGRLTDAPVARPARIERFRGLGLQEDAAIAMVALLEREGSVLQRRCVNARAARLARATCQGMVPTSERQ